MKGEAMAGQVIPVQPTHIVTRMSTDMLAVMHRIWRPPWASSAAMRIA